MVGPDKERKSSSLQPMSPFLESEDDGQQLLIPHVIICDQRKKRRGEASGQSSIAGKALIQLRGYGEQLL